MHDLLHQLNIVLHVSAGSATLLLGLWQLAAAKGGRMHGRRGRWALAFAGISLASAVVGAIIFRPRPDLMAVSLLVSYYVYSGWRCLRLPRNGRAAADWLPALGLGLAALGLAMGQGYFWQTGLVRAIVGAMAFLAVYDLARTSFPTRWRRWLNPAEHAWRMSSMVGAMATVAAGQLLPAAQAAALVSGGFGLLAVLLAWQAARKALGVQPTAALKARLKTDSEL